MKYSEIKNGELVYNPNTNKHYTIHKIDTDADGISRYIYKCVEDGCTYTDFASDNTPIADCFIVVEK